MSRIGFPGSMAGGMATMSGMEVGIFGSNGWTPPLNPSLFYDMDRGLFTNTGGTTPATADGDNVRFLTDYSGNSHNSNDNQSPGNCVLKLAQLNGHNSIRMNGSAAGFQSSWTLNQPATVFVVTKTTWTASRAWWSGSGGSTATPQIFQRTATLGQVRLYAGTGLNLDFAGISDATWYILCVVVNGASTRVRFNAGTSQSGNIGSNNMGGFTLGAFDDVTGGPFVGDFAAALVYNSALSTTDEATVRNDINARFAIF